MNDPTGGIGGRGESPDGVSQTATTGMSLTELGRGWIGSVTNGSETE